MNPQTVLRLNEWNVIKALKPDTISQRIVYKQSNYVHNNVDNIFWKSLGNVDWNRLNLRDCTSYSLEICFIIRPLPLLPFKSDTNNYLNLDMGKQLIYCVKLKQNSHNIVHKCLINAIRICGILSAVLPAVNELWWWGCWWLWCGGLAGIYCEIFCGTLM